MKSKKTKKMSLKLVIAFLIFEFIITGVTAPLLVFYGPFQNVKRTVVGAAMTTLSHQFIAKWFLSDDEINRILSTTVVEAAEKDDSTPAEKVDVKGKHDSEIERYEVKSSRFKGNVLIIHDPLRVKVACSKKLGVEGQMTSQIARDNEAAAAINGGGFTDKTSSGGTWTGTGGTPTGVIMSNGKVIFSDMTDESEKTDMMAITKEGLLLVGAHSMEELKELNVTEAISFGPALVMNGKGTIKSGDGGWGIAPRTAIGQRKDGAMIFLTIDGRQASSLGASLKDVEDIMLKYGAVNAINLDGGSSSTMYFDGDVINNPCDPLGERSVPSAVIVK